MGISGGEADTIALAIVLGTVAWNVMGLRVLPAFCLSAISVVGIVAGFHTYLA